MYSEDLVQVALNACSCSQNELALRLGASPAEIGKWLNGELMSPEMEQKVRAIANIGDKDPSFVLWAGSLEDADKWAKLIRFLAETARRNAETGYNTYPLEDEEGVLCWSTFYTLREMGIDLPQPFPGELDFDYERAYREGNDGLWDLLFEQNPYSALIHEMFASLADVHGFYAAYVHELIFDDELALGGTAADNIEPCLIDLAASKIEVDEALAPRIKQFRCRVMKDYAEWLTIVKDKAFRAGVPLRAELLGMVHKSAEELRREAEAESLGFNARRAHPDIYMNELLCGMRAIHRVLPTIMKKLGIEAGRLERDHSELHVG